MRARRWAAGGLGLLAAVLAVSAAVAGGGPTRLPLQAWLDRPQRDGESIVTDGPVTIQGMTEARFTPRLPAGLTAPDAGGRYLLAAFSAAGGRRLMLAPEAEVASLPHRAFTGVTVGTDAIGVPPAALAELQKALPGLDTRFLTGLSWEWAHGAAPGRAPRAVLVLLALACAGGALASLRAGTFRVMRGHG